MARTSSGEDIQAALRKFAPPYVVLCAFSRFEVWLPGRYPNEPVAQSASTSSPTGTRALNAEIASGARDYDPFAHLSK